jgi:hypothetical protein
MNRIGRRSSGGLSWHSSQECVRSHLSRVIKREQAARRSRRCGLRNVRFRPLLAIAQIGARCSADAESDFAGDGDLQGSADLTHPLVAESAEALDERPQRHALDRIEVDDRGPWNGVLARLEQHLTRDTTDPCRAGPDQRAKARNRQSRESTTTGRRPTPASSHHQTSPRAGSAVTTRRQPFGTRRGHPFGTGAYATSPSVVSSSTLAPWRFATSSTVKPIESGPLERSREPIAITASRPDDHVLRVRRTMHEIPRAQVPLLAFDNQLLRPRRRGSPPDRPTSGTWPSVRPA